jgi:hypothetical protein
MFKLYDITNVPVLFACETWSFTMTETYRMGLFKNRVRRQIFGSKRQNVTGDWRIWHSNDLHEMYAAVILYLLVTESRRMIWAKHGTWIG